MPNQTDKITPSMATDSTGISKAWLYWLTRVSKLIGEKLDIILNATGKVPQINADGELEASTIDADRIVSGPDVSVVGNVVVFDNTTGTLIADFGAPPQQLSGASTVVSETTYGQASAAGSAATYSKGDHTHGTPASPGMDDISDIAITSAEQGDLLYRNATQWVNLHHGTAGQMLVTGGNGANPSWDDPLQAGGADTQVQFNDGGVLGGESTFTYDKSTDTLTLTGIMNTYGEANLRCVPGVEPSIRVDPSTGRICIFHHATPNATISFYGGQAHGIGLERNINAATAGQSLELSAGAPKSGEANQNGGPLILRSGVSTGIGTSYIEFTTSVAGSSGSSDNATARRVRINTAGHVVVGADDTNYAQISFSDGNLTWAGTFKKKLTMRPSLVAGRVLGTTKPTAVIVGSHAGYSMPVWSSDDEELYFREYIAGRWDGASDITVSLIVCLAAAETVGEDFRFKLSWEAVPLTGVLTSNTTDVYTQQEILTGRDAQYSVYKLDFAIDWDLNAHDVTASDHFGCLIRRVLAIGDGVDQVDNEIIVLDCIITYTIDKAYKTA